MPASVQDEILDRLDKILRVMALQVGAEKSITERARLLKMAGVDNRSIAEVLNTSDATIRTLTANLRNTGAKVKKARAQKKKKG
jgi:hypothetical protein